MSKVTMQDIADAVSLSRITVWKALSNRPGVSEELRRQIQHTAGMEESSMVIAINTDANAPINKFADYVITGDLNVVIPKMIQYYKKNSK